MNATGWAGCEQAAVAADRYTYRLTVDGSHVATFYARCAEHARNHARKHYGPLVDVFTVGHQITARSAS